MANFISGQTNAADEKYLSLPDRRERVKGPVFNSSSTSQPLSTTESDDKQIIITEEPCQRSITPLARPQFNSVPLTPPSSSTRIFKPRREERQEPHERLPSTPLKNAPDLNTKQRTAIGYLDTPPSTIDRGTRFRSHASSSREDESLEYSDTSSEPAPFDDSPCPSPTARKSTLRHGSASISSVEELSSQKQGPEETLSPKTYIPVQQLVLDCQTVTDGEESSCSSPEDSRKSVPESPIENSTLGGHEKRPQTPNFQSPVHDGGSHDGKSHDGEVYGGRSHAPVPESFVATPTTKDSSVLPAITPETEIRMKLKDLETLFPSFLSQLYQSSFVWDMPSKTEETEASPVLIASVIKKEENVDTARLSETPMASSASESSQSSPQNDNQVSIQPETILKEDNVVLYQEPKVETESSEKYQKYTEEVWKSWLPEKLSQDKLKEIENILMEPSPDREDSYIYVYCEVSGGGYVDPKTGLSPPNSEDFFTSLPIFWHTDREKWLSLSDALSDKSECSKDSRNPRESSVQKRGPRNLRIKIGRSQKPEKRLKEWEKYCNRKIMLLMLYGFKTDIRLPENPPAKHHRSCRDLYNDSRDSKKCPAQHANIYPSEVDWKVAMESSTIPYCNKIEMLIRRHLHKENKCRPCKGTKGGKPCKVKHEEWFEIPDTVEGIQKVDTAIQRWVAWAKERAVYASDEAAYDKIEKESEKQKQDRERAERTENRNTRKKEMEASER